MLNPISIRGLVSFDSADDEPNVSEVARTDNMSVVVYSFNENQEITPHKADRDIFLYIEQGRVVVTAGEGKVEMGPGQVIVIPAGASRGIEAREWAVVLMIQTPPESY